MQYYSLRTPLGPHTVNCPVYGGVLFSEVSNVHMSCEGLQMGQSSVVLFEVSAFQRCPLIDVSLCILSSL